MLGACSVADFSAVFLFSVLKAVTEKKNPFIPEKH